MSYEITSQDMLDYLASLKDEDIVGIPHNRYSCWVAEAARHKYPTEAVEIIGDNEGVQIGTTGVPLGSDVRAWADFFDELDGPVTLEYLWYVINEVWK